MSMISPSEARRRILAAAPVIDDVDQVELWYGHGRTLGRDLEALHTQPPFPASAMDGYAVRADDLATGTPLRIIGQSAAGHPFEGRVGPLEAVRIFTGAVVPSGAETILMQENAQRLSDGLITPTQMESKGRFVRPEGLDFRAGDVLLKTGTQLAARHVGLAASMGHAILPVRRRPKVALVSTGDELVLPGQALKSGHIISSNNFTLAAMIRQAGGDPFDFGTVPDTFAATRHAVETAASGHDLLITCVGASVGDHDHVQAALVAAGFTIDFWKVAVRPGKPLMMGVRGRTVCIGLPGNPVSSFVCALLFVVPLIRQILGQPDAAVERREPARLGAALPANDMREDYMRATLNRDEDGSLIATPFKVQDSSVQRLLVQADALLVRPAHAPAAHVGEACEIIRL